jgi:DNA-binding NarL/FixJ family response regulator
MLADYPTATRVVIAGPDGLFRGSLRRALATQPGLDIVGEAADTNQLLEQVRVGEPDVVLVDAGLPPDGGCGAVDRVTRERGQGRQVRAVVLADRADDRLLISSLESGADGFVTMDNRLREIAQAIRSVTGGHAYVPPRMLADLLRAVLHRRRTETAVHERFSRLSRREREVLACSPSARTMRPSRVSW